MDLGRFWQILLFVGLLLWLTLMLRVLLPALRNERGVNRQLLTVFTLSVAAIALFYGAGLMWGRETNLAVAEYWRWWVVHLWVEGFFEIFAVAVIALGLTLLSLRVLTMRNEWRTGVLALAFWAMNIGLALMVVLSLLPVGFAQTWASVEYGMWYARSADFLQTPLLETFRWLRAIGDTIFAIGMLAMGWFVVGLTTGWSILGRREDAAS